ncbi:MAG: helix-turn-helix domain-containing protein [Actinobacteria bacterium]|nr:helix-turn-helix domain-containing protein [Actinomycetota bacterium]
MPRTSRHVIELCEDERVELERRAAMVTLPWRVVQRARIVLYAAEGLQDIDIAARLDCSPDSVARRRRRFCAERLEGLEDQARSGRPRRFSPAGGRRGQGDRVRTARQSRPAAITVLAR